MKRNALHGESAHSVAIDPPDGESGAAKQATRNLFRFRYERVPLKIVVNDHTGGRGIADGGNSNTFVLEGEHLRPNSVDQSSTGKTVCVFMHPAAVMNMLPFPAAMARAGCNVVICHSRYANFDFNLILENCLIDLAAVVTYCREEMNFDNIILVGWSGGGSLSCYYQSEAECPQLGLGLVPADALVCIAAHAGRARILTECLDPSIWLHRRGEDAPQEQNSLKEFNLYSQCYRDNPDVLARRLASKDFLSRFRKAQVARNDRITAWANTNPGASFVLDGTMMDPRWISPNIDSNDRTKSWECYLGDPRLANDAATGLCRFSTSESWISQWSLRNSNGDAVKHMRNVKNVPVLVLENGSDNGCPRSHVGEYFSSCKSPDKTYVCIREASHYYSNQKDKLAEAANVLLKWLVERKFVLVSSYSIKNGANEKFKLARLRDRYDGSHAMKISGFNHLALVSSDMEKTCEFYGGVLGLRLTKTIALPNGGQHFFFALDGASIDGSGEPQSLAFFWFGKNAPASAPGISAPSMQQLLATGQHPSASGSMNHVAFNVPEEMLLGYRNRIVRSGLCPFASPIIYHADTKSGMAMERSDPRVTWASVYFFGPDGELLEITSQIGRYDDDRVSHVSVLPKPALWKESPSSRL